MRSLISLGARCDVAFQLRMHGMENTAHFFDWLVSPVTGVIKIIEADFDVFHPDHLVLIETSSPHYVKDIVTGTVFHHQFPFFNGNMQPDFLVHYTSFIGKFAHLAQRFRQYLETKPVTLVRRGITRQEALALEAAVLKRFPGADARFLYVNYEGELFETPHGHSRLLPKNNQSLGDPVAWAELLVEEGLTPQPYQHGTEEILKSHDDDYNLDTQNRFTEAQLLAAIDHVPTKAAYFMEAARWYIGRSKLGQAEAMALRALDLEPQRPDAIGLAALAQWRLGTITHEQAAQRFVNLCAIEPHQAEWPRYAAEALLNVGKAKDALAYINRAVSLAPASTSTYYAVKARCLVALKQPGLAELAINKAILVGRPLPQNFHLQAQILEKLGRTDEAATAAQRAAELAGNEWYLSNLGRLLQKAGKYREALATYTRALAVAKDRRAEIQKNIEGVEAKLSEAATPA